MRSSTLEVAFYCALAWIAGALVGAAWLAPAQASHRQAVYGPDTTARTLDPPTDTHALLGARRACRALSERLDYRWERR